MSGPAIIPNLPPVQAAAPAIIPNLAPTQIQPTAASALLNPAGADNDILLTAPAGAAGNLLTGAIAIDATTDRTQLTAAKVGNAITVTSGDKRRMIVTADFGNDPETFVVTYDATQSNEAGDTWTLINGATIYALGYLFGVNTAVLWKEIDSSIVGEFTVEQVVSSPDLIDWSAATKLGEATGTPTVTAAPATAAQAIAALTAASLGVTAANGPGSDGSGAIAAVAPVQFSGGA
jgi:hypothetical protein